jgi:hypothetical protein
MIGIRTFIFFRSKEETGIRTSDCTVRLNHMTQINEYRILIVNYRSMNDATQEIEDFSAGLQENKEEKALLCILNCVYEHWRLLTAQSQINEDRTRLTVSSHWSQFAYPTINLSGKGMLLRLLLNPLVKLSEVE